MLIKKLLLFLLFSLVLVSGCSRQTEKDTVYVGFSQAMTTDDWRKQMNKSMQIEASLRPEVKLEIRDAQNNIAHQIKDIEDFIINGADVIIVSPIQSKPITPIVEKAIKAGVKVLIVDRKIEGENYTSYLGADNIEVGRIAGRYIISNYNGTGKIVEITGAKGSSPAHERSLGFNQAISLESRLNIIGRIQGNWEKESVKEPLQALLEKEGDIEYIFAHNDRMALSAWETARTMGLEKQLKFIGVDGLNTPNGGIHLVKEGILEATILYPTGGNEALKLALSLHRNEAVSKNNTLNTIVIDQVNAEIIENQMDKVDQQQNIIESQQEAISIQESEYASQYNLLRLLSLFLVIILSLAVYSVYSTVFISRKKRELEKINATVVAQKDEIQAMAEVARESNEAKLNFFTGLSHEFKTPLTLILSYSESLIENEKLKGTSLLDEAKLIYNNSNRLLRLINQLLDFRKLEERKFTLRARKINICSFAEELIKNFKGEAVKRNINFKFICDSTNTELFLDQNLIDKVFFNLLSNAFKFTPDNGHIEVVVKETDDVVKIYFRDSGIGIPEGEIQQVFNPFFRASNNNKNSSGIGLHLSKEFVLLHKGMLEVRSKHGTEFIITLPKGESHLSAGEIATNKNDDYSLYEFALEDNNYLPVTDGAQEMVKHSLFIIEDNPDLVHFLKTKLSGEYEIHTSDGSDAVNRILDIIPDIILCDVNLADKDGFEISKIIKKDLRTSHIPIIILSALSNKESVIKGLQSGIDQYLTKPFSLAILKQSIVGLLFNREKLRYYYTNNIYKVEPESKFGQQEQTFVYRMTDLINANIDNTAFSVEDLAERLGLSRVQLYRKVKAILGISISDHINNIRLEKAIVLLKHGDMNISEIAYSLGFSSPNYFSTAFKNKYGVTPKEFKSGQ